MFEIAKEDARRRIEIAKTRSMGPRFRGGDVVVAVGHRMISRIRPGVIAALGALALDQASKIWLLRVFDGIADRGVIKLTPFFDLVLAWNIGISFGWFQSDDQFAQIALMVVKAVAVIALAIWMTRSHTLLATVALGLIIGGAIGNAIDRAAYGAVLDFALFHVQIAGKTYNWYVFNLADVAIVAGVAALLYDSFLGVPAAKAP
jgi:signal peptidase II